MRVYSLQKLSVITLSVYSTTVLILVPIRLRNKCPIFIQMTNQNISFLIFFMSIVSTVYAQSYVDIAKVSYSTVVNAGFEDNNAETNLSLFNAAFTVPIPITEKTALITGIDVIHQGLDLFPSQSSRTLAGLTFKAGISLTHNDRWSGTYILLPKVVSEDLEIEDDAFFIGGIALLKFQKNERVQYRFGVYASGEAFGTLVTPLLGLYYKNETTHWETTLNLPINGDVNYSVNDYFEHTIAKNILLKVQTGYTSLDYQVFADGDTLPFRLAAFEFGDDRTRLNPEMNGNFFVKASATYRFDIPNK